MNFLLFLLQADTIDEAAKATESARETLVNMVDGFWSRLPYLAVGLVIVIAFFVIASIVKRVTRMAMARGGFDQMISSLVSRIVYIAVTIVGLFIASVVIFPGLTPGDLIAGLGIGSVALGFAFKDVLQNLFAGFLILLYRPFKIGDQIKIDDYEGIVEEITVRATNIRTLDGERVVIPNSNLYMNSVLVRTAFAHRRTNIIVGIGYGEDIEKARSLIIESLDGSENVMKEPKPSVEVVELADSSVNLRAQYWTKSIQRNVRESRDEMYTKIKYRLDEEGIEIPFPQRVVYTQSS